MIIKGSQRAGARSLATHLMNTQDNDHIEVHELRGFVSDDLSGAFLEAEALSKGTRCKQFLFSVSLSPPETETVRPEVFELAAQKIEKELGLEGQPRAIVFHEKEGRRHAHAVWSRIDTENMRAINLPHFKRKLNEISRGLFLEHGWNLPDGYKRGQNRSPLNFTLAEWQQAKRAGKNPAEIKATFQECWNASKDGEGLTKTLQERGYFLARGDRRAVVAIDYQGEVYSLARMTGTRTKDVRALIGDRELASVAETKARIADLFELKLKRHVETARAESGKRMAPLQDRKAAMVEGHKAARQTLKEKQAERWTREATERQARFSKGLRGFWDWLRGKHRGIRKRNEMEVALKRDRDRAETHGLIQKQQAERQGLQQDIQAERRRHTLELAGLYRDLARTKDMRRGIDPTERKSARTPPRQRGQEPGRGPRAGPDRTLERNV